MFLNRLVGHEELKAGAIIVALDFRWPNAGAVQSGANDPLIKRAYSFVTQIFVDVHPQAIIELFFLHRDFVGQG